MSKQFVVVVDCQYDFMMPDGILYVPGAEQTIEPITRFLAALTPDDTAGVIFTYDTHTREQYTGSDEEKLFPIHCELGTKGHRNVINRGVIADGIEIFELHKPIFDMWGPDSSFVTHSDTQLEDLFNSQSNADVDTVVVVGVATNFCVKQAVDGFLVRGFKVQLYSDMMRGIDTGKPGDLDAAILFADEIADGRVVYGSYIGPVTPNGQVNPVVVARYNDLLADVTPVFNPEGVGINHARWMLNELVKFTDREKAMRWLGFVQHEIVSAGYTTVTAERDFTRPFFKKQ